MDGFQRFLRDELGGCFADRAYDRIDLLVSFIMKSGLAAIGGPLTDALDRGVAVRVLTTDYLHVTDADALTTLLDLTDAYPDGIQTRIFHDERRSFHPKAYLFRSRDGSVATGFVGSSNLSASGISGGVEWNLGGTASARCSTRSNASGRTTA